MRKSVEGLSFFIEIAFHLTKDFPFVRIVFIAIGNDKSLRKNWPSAATGRKFSDKLRQLIASQSHCENRQVYDYSSKRINV